MKLITAALLQVVLSVSIIDATLFVAGKDVNSHSTKTHAMIPNPNPYQVTYKDGTKSPLIRLRMRQEGEDEDSPVHLFEETIDGFTVSQSEDGGGKYTYLDVDEESGELIDTQLVAGIDDPVSFHIHKDPLKISDDILRKKHPTSSPSVDDSDVRKLLRGGEGGKIVHKNTIHNNDGDVASRRRAAITTGTLNNLVIPFKFADHVGRTVPSRSDLDILMNNQGSHPLCPTGSVRDVYLLNSFSKLDLQSTVLDWVTIDYTESYCADGNAGLWSSSSRSGKMQTCLVDALNKAAAASGINFADFDLDENGFIDGMTFFTQGTRQSMVKPMRMGHIIGIGFGLTRGKFGIMFGKIMEFKCMIIISILLCGVLGEPILDALA